MGVGSKQEFHHWAFEGRFMALFLWSSFPLWIFNGKIVKFKMLNVIKLKGDSTWQSVAVVRRRGYKFS